jgi:hypothetical protein
MLQRYGCPLRGRPGGFLYVKKRVKVWNDVSFACLPSLGTKG